MDVVVDVPAAAVAHHLTLQLWVVLIDKLGICLQGVKHVEIYPEGEVLHAVES